MAYSTTTNDGVTISVADENIDSSTLSVSLIGRNATNYGQSIVENSIKQLENFASSAPPTSTVTPTGQLWYNKTEGTMRVNNGSTWERTSKVPVSATAISSNITAGTAYFNSTTDQLKVYDGSVFRDAVLPGGTVTSEYAGNVSASGNASNYGAKVETLFLKADANTSPSIVPVVAFKYVSDATSGVEGELADSAHGSANATVLAIISPRDFTIDGSDPYYTTLSNSDSIGSAITAGLNLRQDSTGSSIAQSNVSATANVALALNDGSSNISGSDFIHTGTFNWVPATAVSTSYTLGNATNRFGNIYVGTVNCDTLSVASSSPTVFGANIDGTNASFSGDVVVSGNVDATYFNGTATSARYADLAEKYASDEEYEPGTVVKIGGDAEITATTSHADTEVFGVISTDPAYLMNNSIDGLPVALQGRVPVKVVGKVKKGERLVSSDVPGVAWGVAGEDVPLQAIIGRALHDKDDGEQGTIEAVIGVK